MATPTSTCRTFHLIFILLWLFVSAQDDSLSSSPNTRLLNQIMSYVNQSVPACSDYYEYACGKWVENHVNDSFLEITGLINQKVNEDLITLMVELSQRRPLTMDNTSVEAKVFDFYQSCRRKSQSIRTDTRYLLLLPPNEQIPWPQFIRRFEAWGSSKFQWMETLARLRRYGLNNVLFHVNVLPRLDNSSKYIINIKMANFHKNNSRLKGWLLTKLHLCMLGVSTGKAEILAGQLLTLESTVRYMARIYSESPKELNLQQLEEQVGGQWRKYFEILLGHTVPADYVFQVDNPTGLTALMKFINDEDREELASYIMLRLVSYLHEYSSDSDDQIECVQDVRRYMELAVNLLYEQRFIGSVKLQQHQADVRQLFEQVRKQFLKKLDENYPSLADSDLEMLRAKLLNMTINIGNMPQRADRSSFVKWFYADLQLVNDDYAVNHLRVLELQTRRWFEQLDKPFNATDHFYISDPDTAISSTPYYMLRQNVIIVPYGILQEPIFHHDAHDVFKISLLGFMLGHELMHGFGSGALIYDHRGNYNEKGAQIILHSKYTSDLNCLKRDETGYLDEREADFGGIHLAYDAYFAPGSKFNQSQPNFTNLPLKQIFFLNLAQFFCGNTYPMNFKSHDTDRLTEMLINFPAFAEAHSCRQDHDYMHPAQKCRLW